jgi:hypothetical protein
MTAPTPAWTQREHDADDLVTEDMINEAIRVYRADERIDKCLGKILRAVAPMIAARAMDDDKIRDRVVVIAKRMVAAEREACARLAADMGRAWEADGIGDDGAAEAIAAAIRARGETT